ncbi:hypothetical protein Tco_0336431 [Tanacetum coccineum]
MACDEYSSRGPRFSKVIASGKSHPYFEPLVHASPNFTPFGSGTFSYFEEADSFLALEGLIHHHEKVDDKLPVIIAKDLKDGKGKHSEGHICYVKKALEYTDHSAIKVSFCHEKMLRPRLHAVESCCSQEFVYENSRQNIGAENLAAVICILEERWEKHRCLGQDKLEMLYGPFRTALQNTNRRGDHQESSMNELNELRDQARELSDLIKRKPMRITMLDQKKPRFNVGDRVLLFNSRLMIFSGKLKSRLSGPFTVCPVFPYGTVGELSQIPGPTF